MIDAALFFGETLRHGASVWSGVPCSYLQPFINYVLAAPGATYVGAANEGDAVAIAAGAWVGGVGRGIAIFQNSGLGNAVNPLTSLTETMRIPVLLVVTWRGEPGGPADEPQHELMGAITTDMLSLLRIRWEYFPGEAAEVGPVLARASAYMDAERRPFALVMRKDSVAPWPHVPVASVKPPGEAPSRRPRVPVGCRRDALAAIRRAVAADDVIIATTGYTGRELYALGDDDRQFYMVGSMGCASSFGLGLALAQPARRIVVVDGDGAALMRLGAMATLGHRRPANLCHVVIDNGCHESTGGQATVAPSIDFPGVAAACGYPDARRASSLDELEALVAAPAAALTFVHVAVTPGVAGTLPRPAITPPEATARLRRFLRVPAA